MSLSKKRLKSLALELFTKSWNNQDPFPNDIVEVLQDLIDFKLHPPTVVSKPKVQKQVFMKIYFHNKGIEKINLPQMMKKIQNQIPSTFRYQEIPRIIYKRSPTIARRIFNYKLTVTTLDCKGWITSPPWECDCKESEFCDPHHGHIMTGNLGIIKNSKLRSLLSKGPKYREKERLNWNKVQSCIDSGIDQCTVSWARSENVDVKLLSEWKVNLNDLVKKKIKKIIETKKLRGFGNQICLKTLNRQMSKVNYANCIEDLYLFRQTKHKIIFQSFVKNFI